MLQMEDLSGGVSIIRLHESRSLSQPTRPTTVTGSDSLLPTLSSYLMTPYSSAEDNPIPGASDIQNALCAVDFISTCRLEELHAQITYGLSPRLFSIYY